MGDASTRKDESAVALHGARNLPSVEVDTYNADLRDGEGFIGDRASGRAFRAILEAERELVRDGRDDPMGATDSSEISKKSLDKTLVGGDALAAGVVLSTIEEFAQEFFTVIEHFMRLKEWRNTQRIVVGGGLRASRIGELAIGRTAVLVKGAKYDLELLPIRQHPDEAGLIGCAHLSPSWMFHGHDGVLAVDIGGANIRAGIIQLNLDKAADLSSSRVWETELWRYAEEKPNRKQAVERLGQMLKGLIKRAAKKKLTLAPFIGIGCPGLIREDGSIEKGGQNLPGNWQHANFNLPQLIRECIPKIDGHDVLVVMHNDAVVQGLSEAPFMEDVERWGVMTIGTGLGNARFTNRNARAG